MEVRGMNAFSHFIQSNGFNGLSTEINAFIVCLEEYDRLCACDSPEYREHKKNECRQKYNASLGSLDRFKTQIISQTGQGRISFFNDENKLIKTLSR